MLRDQVRRVEHLDVARSGRLRSVEPQPASRGGEALERGFHSLGDPKGVLVPPLALRLRPRFRSR